MKLICSIFGLELDFPENEIQVLRIESSSLFLEFTELLWEQCATGEGDFVFSYNFKERRLDKEAELILNPFQIDLNNRKILTKLYQELKERAVGTCLEETLKVENYLEQYIIRLCDEADYPIIYKPDVEISNVFKLFDVRLDDRNTDVSQRIAQYVKTMHKVLNVNLVIFINLKDFFSVEVLEELYRTLCYEKVGVLLVERYESKSIYPERLTIIDKDACLIYDR